MKEKKNKEKQPATTDKNNQDKKKVPLFVFAGMFNKDIVKLKGLYSGVVGRFYRTLKKCEAEGEVIVVTIDEFKMSRTCNLCFGDRDIIKAPEFKGYNVLHCVQCGKVWQHDVNAALNMMTIAKHIWMSQGRPEVFKPKKKDQENS